MATATGAPGQAPKALECQTWVLKVSIHCQGCKRKVKKVLQGIEGVYTATVDSQLNKVTVTGNIGVETLIKKLVRTGKHAEIWPGNLATKQKESSEAKDKSKQNTTKTGENCNGNGKPSGHGKSDREAKTAGNLPEKSTASKELPAVQNNSSEDKGGRGKKGGKKNKKGPKGNNNGVSGSCSGSPFSGATAAAAAAAARTEIAYQTQGTRQYLIASPQGFYVPAAFATSPGVESTGEGPSPFYYVPLNALAHTYDHAARLDSFHIFSDENVNGCSVM